MSNNYNTIPRDIYPMLDFITETATTMLKDKEYLQPVWFLINRADGNMIPVMSNFFDHGDKHAIAQFVRHIVKQEKADAVIFLAEAFSNPGREDIISITVETYDGIWVAGPVVTGQPGECRKLASINFEALDAIGGDLGNYLPPRNKNEIN